MAQTENKSDENSSTATSQVSHPDPVDARESFPALEPLLESAEDKLTIGNRKRKGKGKLKGKGKGKFKIREDMVGSQNKVINGNQGSEKELPCTVQDSQKSAQGSDLDEGKSRKEGIQANASGLAGGGSGTIDSSMWGTQGSVGQGSQEENCRNESGPETQDVSDKHDNDKMNNKVDPSLQMENGESGKPSLANESTANVRRSETFPQFLPNRKSGAEPALSDVTATQVEVAKEVDEGLILSLHTFSKNHWR